jgi:acyl-CoA dehydrogenase
MGIPFQNGPTSGHDVFVPIDFIIGGPAGVGQGWRMLMESLAACRSISLPALSVGAVQLAARVVGAYATVREQFDTPIGRFEGIEEPLARIGGWTYLMSAARILTAGAVDAGERPAVVSAIAKCYLTEGMRAVLSDAMDIRAGAGICRGPRNMLARAYVAAPIAITVEGANILTRSMIIYGQGAIRCHPYVREEIRALAAGDLAWFDRAVVGHLGFVVANAARAFLLGLTGARLARPQVPGPLAPHLRRLSRMSAAFALVSDAAMITLGGHLKRREKLSGRLADALAWLYLASASVKRFWDEGQPERDRPVLDWVCRHALYQIQSALGGLLDNLPNRLAARVLRWIVFPLGPATAPRVMRWAPRWPGPARGPRRAAAPHPRYLRPPARGARARPSGGRPRPGRGRADGGGHDSGRGARRADRSRAGKRAGRAGARGGRDHRGGSTAGSRGGEGPGRGHSGGRLRSGGVPRSLAVSPPGHPPSAERPPAPHTPWVSRPSNVRG